MWSWKEKVKFQTLYDEYYGNLDELISRLAMSFPGKREAEIKKMITWWKERKVQKNILKSKKVSLRIFIMDRKVI